MHNRISGTIEVPVIEVVESMTWNRERTTEELMSFISGRHAKLEDVELGI